MVFKNFTVNTVLHLVLIIGISCCTTYFFIIGEAIFGVFGSLFIIADSMYLVYSFNRTNNSLAYFFESVENEDSQLRFYTRKRNKSIQRLYESMNRVNKIITETKLQNQRNEQYYKALIQQSVSGLIAMGPENNIEIANDKACELVGIMVPVNFRRLETKNPPLWSLLCKMKPGETETFKMLHNGIFLHLLIRATGLRFYDRQIKLVSLQDIKHEMDAKETESWQKLISILTHEIMNSIAPITSLSATLSKFFKKDGQPLPIDKIDNKVIENTIQGLEIIGERGNGLMNFVTNYRQLTKIPKPVFTPFSASEWLNNLRILLFEKLEEHQVSFDVHIDKQVKAINGDEKLLTQVLLNLIYNAIDALAAKTDIRKIKVLVEHGEQSQVQISVINNGPSIPADLQDKIFVPFFTTKENGSGIGLSLSRQIIQLHHGYMYLESDESLTKFVIVL